MRVARRRIRGGRRSLVKLIPASGAGKRARSLPAYRPRLVGRRSRRLRLGVRSGGVIAWAKGRAAAARQAAMRAGG